MLSCFSSFPDGVSKALTQSAAVVFAASDFVSQACERDPALLADLVQSGDLETAAVDPEQYYASRAPVFDAGESAEASVMRDLRRWRVREQVRIAWRDLAGWAPIDETLRSQSAFADAAIRVAHQQAKRITSERHGVPRSADGQEQDLIVVGMGKLGGGELNFSSDIDLVFLFPEGGETDGPRPLANEDFFTRMGQCLIRLLGTRTEHGFVFRVDMRLRPFGDSGPLVSSFAAFDDYLQMQGRDWERYAWIKARAVTGTDAYARIYNAAVRPFVYRRYLDYGVFASLREMKAMIEREMERRELSDDVKLGPGGIREIEFLVQALQLIRGGQDAGLRTPSLLAALPRLGETRLLPMDAVAELRAAYDFLRLVENRLQMRADAQTHVLPRTAAEQAVIAAGMGAADWPALLARLDEHRARVRYHFRMVISGEDREGATGSCGPVLDLESLDDSVAALPMLVQDLVRAGWTGPTRASGASAASGTEAPPDLATAAARRLLTLRGSTFVRRLDDAGRRRLQSLLPKLIVLIAAQPEPLAVLGRVLDVVEAIGQRSAYFALLNERSDARARLVMLCGTGDFLSRQIAATPLLLDELLDERQFDTLPGRAALGAELEARLDPSLADDPERQVEALRHFQRAAVFRVAVADLTGRLPVMRVSDHLTGIAELILEKVLQLSLQQISAQYGAPMCGDGDMRRPVAIGVAGYGKLGGRELGYSSDLDLVFLHDSIGERQETEGAGCIDNQVFFMRLAQRILHLLTMHSHAGRLYEVDVRLRPSGKGGMHVTSIKAFAEYQCREAWTWEHQALLHARAVAGDPGLRAAFEAVRADVLQHHVRRDGLREEVRKMRERMRKELSRGGPGRFDIKQDAGGVADIEFLAQYWALDWALRYPPVMMFSDTIRQLESVASADLVPQLTVDGLVNAYRAYRERTHRLALEGNKPVVDASEFQAERAAVSAVWRSTFLQGAGVGV